MHASHVLSVAVVNPTGHTKHPSEPDIGIYVPTAQDTQGLSCESYPLTEYVPQGQGAPVGNAVG